MRERQTKRLVDCLQWMKEGKSYTEISVLLGVNAQRARYICREARIWRDTPAQWTDGLPVRVASALRRSFTDRAHFERWLVAHNGKLTLIEGIHHDGAKEILQWREHVRNAA